MKHEIAIIGAGIIGITNAIKLLENGFKVTVITKDPPLRTNSDAAVASWYPSSARKPLLQKLCFDSLQYFDQLSCLKNSGISWIKVVKYMNNENGYLENPWIKMVESKDGLPQNYIQLNEFKCAIPITIPLADVNIYRPYLLNWFYELGGKIIIEEVSKVIDLIDKYKVIINCCGWEAKYLANDHRSHPVRGQTIIIEVKDSDKIPLSFDAGSLNAYARYRPQSLDCVIGTSYKVNDKKTAITQQETEDIYEKVELFIPNVREYKVKGIKVGLRSGRWDVRVGPEWISSGTKESFLVHNYGHNSSGFSASWANAKMVLDEVIRGLKHL